MQFINLQGVRVHNLKNIDLKLPLNKLIVITGVSGSGKSSLAFDTLFAEGQRRYIESFSTYARQFLTRLDKPDADRIDNLPPAIAIRQGSINQSARSTVGTTTEIHDYLRLLYAKLGQVVCPDCHVVVTRDTPESAFEITHQFASGIRFQVVFEVHVEQEETVAELVAHLKADGFHRAIRIQIGDEQLNNGIASATSIDITDIDAIPDGHDRLWIIIDRLVAGKSDRNRLLDSIELAFRQPSGRCIVLEQLASTDSSDVLTFDGAPWRVHTFTSRMECDSCQREFLVPDSRLLNFNTPFGACPECEGFGSIPAISFEKLVPDPSKSLRDGAIVAWTTPAYAHELNELLDLAADYGIPVDVPFSDLKSQHLALITDGVEERNFGGLRGFFRWLERNRYKLSVRVFLNRWRAYESCPKCKGDRLNPEALSVRLIGENSTINRENSDSSADQGPIGDSAPNISQLCRMEVTVIASFIASYSSQLTATERKLAHSILRELDARLHYLTEVGLGYLALDRTAKTLSTGEAQRVALTAALGSNLVNSLYVLDEPSAGLHPRDSQQVIAAIQNLHAVGNTVIVVEHEHEFLRAAEFIVDVGPGAGRKGGEVVFAGAPDALEQSEDSITGAYLAGRRQISCADGQADREQRGWLELTRASHNTLKNITVRFPLGVLCVVTGVSGSGKSSLIQETLYPGLCHALGQPCSMSPNGKFESLSGVDQIDEVVMADQRPLGRSKRSNPVTYMKAFDEIRSEFAKEPEAKLRNFTAKHFSFNANGGGKCPKCEGHGSIAIDMQFLADIAMTCPECHGSRYQREILEVKYRGLTISDVLNLTVEEAFQFFRGQPKLQKRLRFLKDVGLEYLPLGQPVSTLSGGESQRLKLASFLAGSARSRCLFLLDEPTIGLHSADVEKLFTCFNHLLEVGHSLIVIEHHLDVIKAADYIIDLGPEAGAAGGRLVAEGKLESICGATDSITGQYLRAQPEVE